MKQYALSLLFVLTLYTPSVAADYFWIGGAGNWSDISHWSTSSGGVITHDQVPTADDDVYFDVNSFTGPGQQVIINNENIFCKNLDWIGANGFPSFTGDAAKVIHIFGELHLIPAMDFSFLGQVRFRAANADTPLQTAGLPLGNSVFFVGDGGWILQDSLVVDSLILLEDGHLNTNSFNVQAGYLYTDIQNSGSLSLGNSKITLHGQNIYQAIGDEFFAHFVLQLWSNEKPFNIDPGTSQIELTASDAQVDIQVNAPLQLHKLLFSSAGGTGLIRLFFAAPVRFETLTFRNNGDIWGDLGGQQLVLTAGKFYNFAAGFTYPFDQILAPGSCLANITLQGSETDFGQTAEFNSNGESIVLEYVNLKNTTATGTSSFVANNSVDLGNTAGWTINSRSVQNLYWVGGAGNWNDPNHWSLTSGGVGGACIPSGTDNVFFDANSFTVNNQSVLITAENIFCRDMTWTGSGFFPSLEGGYDPSLHIFGSLTLIPEMNYRFGGLVKFESQEIGKTITSGNQLINKIEFNSTQGEWSLLDSLKSETFILLNAGSLITNDQYVECTEFSNGNSGLSRRLTLGNTHWVIKHFPDARKDIWFVELAGFELNAGTSTIEFVGIGGYFEHAGTGNINYHKLIFNNEVSYLYNFATTVDCTIDSLQFNHGGYVQSDYQINTLILRPGFTYIFKENTTQTLGEIVAPGDCNKLITLKSDATGNAAFFAAFLPQTDLQYLSIRDIHSVGTGNLAAQNSIDLANNIGWMIEELGNRTLYWVGGNGDWGDPAHWSLSSGGAGGQCVPTLRDDVFFDLNSFTGPNQTVVGQSLNGYYCRNITWSNDLPDPLFNLNRLYCHGSASFSPDMTNQLAHFHMSGDGTQTTLYNNQQLNLVYLDGIGTYTFLDALTAEELILRSGSWNANDQNITLQRWRMQNQNTNLNLLLGQAYIKIDGAFDNLNHSLEAPFGTQTSIDPGGSIVEITHPFASAYLSGDLQFHNVIFSGTDGQLQVSHPANSSSQPNPARFNLLEFGGDAIIKGYHSTDTLVFAPGKSYQLEHQVTQTVNEHLQILGNNCNPIALFSTLPGEKATIFLPTATVIGDFIQMRDQIAGGGATVYAGVHSTDIDNSNQGWIFEGSPSFTDVGFFGADQTICSGDVLQLSAYNYSPGETYEWSTASVNESIAITDAGNYWARVTFGNMCEIIDTIQINTIEPAVVNLGPDRAICEGEGMLLEVETNDLAVSYLWQDGSTDSSFESTQAGIYFVSLNREGCLSSDTLILDLLPSPIIDLGVDQSACQGELLSLDATITQTASYLWQDGSTNPTLSTTQSGNYAVTITANGCTGQDEINITFNAIPSFSLGPDTSLCSGQSLAFDFANLGDSYLWQDGNTNNTNTIDLAGLFWLQIQADGCSARDTILVDLFQTPTIDLGADQELCEGELVLLDAEINQNATYLWQDGSTSPTLSTTQSGNYAVSVTANGCSGQDQINITFHTIPSFSLGPDTSLCSGQSLAFDFANLGDSYLWQDGNTNNANTIDQAGLFWLQIQADGCSARDTILVDLFQTPTIDLGADQELCEGELVLLDAEINQNAAYLWQDGSISPTLSTTQSGNYSVTITANGCSGQDATNITFHPIPLFSLGPDTSLCSGQSLAFDFANLGDSYLWQDGNTNNTNTIEQAGLFWLQVQANGCSASDTILVDLFQTPTIDLGADQELCEGELVLLDVEINQNATYLWQDGSTSPTLSTTQSGNYAVSVTANGCSGQDQINITFNASPSFSLGPDTSLCSGQSLAFNFANLGDSYLWQDGTTTNTNTIDLAGLFWLQIQADGCSARDTILVDLFQTPTIDLGADQELCEGELVLLDVEINQNATYLWQDGSTSPTLSTAQSGNYSVSVTANGCTGQDATNIIFYTIPSFSLGPDTSLCSGQSLAFDFANLGDSYLWQDGNTNNTNTIDQDGLYWLQVERNGCITADSIIIMLQSSPQVDLGEDQVICQNETLLLEVMLDDYDNFYWQDGNFQSQLTIDQSGVYWVEAVLGSCLYRDSIQVVIHEPIALGLPDSILLCAGQSQILRPKVPSGSLIIWQDGTTNDTYQVTKEGIYSLMVDDGNCLTNATLEVLSSSCGQIPVYIPTIFSPNDDGLNDHFAPNFDASYPVIDYELKVFDRWGGLVFSSNNPKEGWPGTVRSREASEGVYVYMLRFQFEDQGETFVQNLAGDISLIR